MGPNPDRAPTRKEYELLRYPLFEAIYSLQAPAPMSVVIGEFMVTIAVDTATPPWQYGGQLYKRLFCAMHKSAVECTNYEDKGAMLFEE